MKIVLGVLATFVGLILLVNVVRLIVVIGIALVVGGAILSTISNL